LEDLWLNDNQILSLDGVENAVAGSREVLTTIYLERNPCVSVASKLLGHSLPKSSDLNYFL
jgi:protein phosphatase 1 regulatory subunit 7